MAKGTPSSILEIAFKTVGLGSGDYLLDMGCRDGRVVQLASLMFGCKSVGIEIDKSFANKANGHTKKLKLDNKVSIIHGDLLKTDLTKFSVIYVFQSGLLLKKLSKKLCKEAKHAKIIALDYPLCKMKPTKTVDVEPVKGHRPRRLYFYGDVD